MAETKKGKGLFDNIISSLTGKEKQKAGEKKEQALEDSDMIARAEMENRRRKEAEARAAAEKAQAEAKVRESAAAAAKAKAEAENKAKAEARARAEAERQRFDAQRAEAEARAREVAAKAAAKAEAERAAAAQIKATHTVKADETLSHIALRYYGNAAKPFWMLIYEANKDVIGDNPGIIRPGQEFKIPELPEDMK